MLLDVGNTRFYRGTGGRMSAALPPPPPGPAPGAPRPPSSRRDLVSRLASSTRLRVAGHTCLGGGLPTSEAFYATGLNLNISAGTGPACSRKVHCTAPRFLSVPATSCRGRQTAGRRVRVSSPSATSHRHQPLAHSLSHQHSGQKPPGKLDPRLV